MKKDFTVKNLILIAVFSAITAVCSWITIPFLTIPFTMQTFAVFLALRFLGGRDGTLAILIYILMGAVGVPVFSGFGAGFGVILGPTGGYIVGFLLCAFLFWALEKPAGKSAVYADIILFAGLLLCYVFGTLWFIKVMSDKGTTYTFSAALSACVLPFVVPDVLKLALSHVVGIRLKKTGH